MSSRGDIYPLTVWSRGNLIAWAAGIFEGEGSCSFHRQEQSGTQQVVVVQKDPWILEHLKNTFGGAVGKRLRVHVWTLTGPRARAFLKDVYPFLSPRRQEQARRALEGAWRSPLCVGAVKTPETIRAYLRRR